MTATDVYNIACALPKEELHRLYNMLGEKTQVKKELKCKKKKLPDFTVEDGIRYLIDNHLNKVRKP